jgi:transcriptional regulator with XRE-family HTH domain
MAAFHTVDVHVGNRMRTRRKMAGMSQVTLAKASGVTFQQVQKYERGANRVSASRLYEIARIQGVTVAYYFEGLNDGRPATADPELAERETARRAVAEEFGVAGLLDQLAALDPARRDEALKLVTTVIDFADHLAAGRPARRPAELIAVEHVGGRADHFQLNEAGRRAVAAARA